MTNAVPPGWYPDPSRAVGRRYFDGQLWTEYHTDTVVLADDRHRRSSWAPVWSWLHGVVMLLGLGAGVAYLGSAKPSAAVTVRSANGDNLPPGPGVDFPGKHRSDTGLRAGDSAVSGSVTTTSTQLTARTALGDTLLCTRVTITNDCTEPAGFDSLLDWKLQDPAGNTEHALPVGVDDTLGSGDVATGASASGGMCFVSSDPYPSGTYVVLLQPLFSRTTVRIGWMNEL